eukprot:TRINITY_DN7527_c0_g1_i2.p1 TRINITY_DN7527_c0_g1~~TRINITY_DN7527_c0_g1_i2.p1  ORF type:complete len:117 (-),score=13.63 TRINITY_DN7527_c0_g1_i2:10-360(-)
MCIRDRSNTSSRAKFSFFILRISYRCSISFVQRSANLSNFSFASLYSGILDRIKSESMYAYPVLCVDTCLLYTSDAADEEDSVDLGGRRIIKKKKKKTKQRIVKIESKNRRICINR